MQNSVAAKILSAEVAFEDQPFAHPLHISSGCIDGLTVAEARVRVRVDGQEATGRGNIFLSDLWAWPDPEVSHAARDQRLRALCRNIASGLPDLCGATPAHPLALGLRLHDAVCEGRDDFAVPSVLARAMALSPFDAAIHDAVGNALRCSAFAFYHGADPIDEADRWLQGAAAKTIQAMLHNSPVNSLPAWWIVGGRDDLREMIRDAVQTRHYHCFKLKLTGHDNATDVARTREVFRALAGAGVAAPRLTVDTNEGNPDADSVLDYLKRLRDVDHEAYAALEYLEQPTGRDILAHGFDWRPVTRLKPVLLDEGLTRLDLLDEARAQGWSGLALKTCKGHSFALVAAAWARQNGMPLALQDLTNPGVSLLHAALFAAHVPTINGAELNSPQFAPCANLDWVSRYPALFSPVDGFHHLPTTPLRGLGFEP